MESILIGFFAEYCQKKNECSFTVKHYFKTILQINLLKF